MRRRPRSQQFCKTTPHNPRAGKRIYMKANTLDGEGGFTGFPRRDSTLDGRRSGRTYGTRVTRKLRRLGEGRVAPGRRRTDRGEGAERAPRPRCVYFASTWRLLAFAARDP